MSVFLEDHIEKEFLEDCIGKDIGNISQEELEDYFNHQEDKLYNRRKMIVFANKVPLFIRRKYLTYRTVLDEDGKPYSDLNIIKVKDLSIKHMEAILRWTDFEYTSNDNLLLHTIHEELIQRKWGKVG